MVAEYQRQVNDKELISSDARESPQVHFCESHLVRSNAESKMGYLEKARGDGMDEKSESSK